MTLTLNAPIRTQVRTIDGVSIRFAESDKRGGADALLTSPWPESPYAFEPAWSRLADHAHLVAIDLPGFGRSERRNELMSPRAMGEFLVRVADAFGLESPHVVGTGATAVPLQVGDPLKEWVEAPDLEPYRRIDGRQVVTAAMSTLERYQPTDAAREDYLLSYEGERFAESMRYVQTYPTELPVLRDLLPSIQTPVQIFAGRRDRVVPLVNAEFLHEWLPLSRLAVLDTGHWAWEDAADEYAALVTAWWDGGYAAVERRSS
jgi:pimeloyl-ACP methyl ester carboxylesterase